RRHRPASGRKVRHRRSDRRSLAGDHRSARRCRRRDRGQAPQHRRARHGGAGGGCRAAEKATMSEAPARMRPAGPFGPFERMVAWRYLRSRRKETVISVIASISFAGIMLGVATLIIVMAVMNGFRAELLSRILGINGHIIVQPIDGNFSDYADLA